jgi:hypothetical protein
MGFFERGARGFVSLSDNAGHAAVTYCYWDEKVRVWVGQSNHRVGLIRAGGQEQCSYQTREGVSCGVTLSKVNRSFDLGTPDGKLTQYGDFSHLLERVGFRNDEKGSE